MRIILLLLLVPSQGKFVPPPGKTVMVVGGGYLAPEWNKFAEVTGKTPGGAAHWQCDYSLSGVLYQGQAAGVLLIHLNVPTSECDAVLGGRRDDRLRGIADQVHNLRKPVYVVLMGEADFRTRHGLAAEKYRDVYRRVRRLWRDADNVAWVFHMACDQNPSEAEIEALYPGDAEVDMVGCSFYGRGNLEGAARLARFGKRRGKPFAIVESSATFVQKGNGVRSWDGFFGPFFDFVRRNDARVVMYNNIQDSAASAGVPVDSFLFMSPPVLAGWKREMASPRYLTPDQIPKD